MELQPDKYYKLCEIDGYLMSERSWRRRIREGKIRTLRCKGLFVKGEWIQEFVRNNTVNVNLLQNKKNTLKN